jgi:hypothetical protein
MRFETRWIEPIRRNQVKSTSEQELRTVIIKIADRNNEIRSLVRSVKKVQKLRTAILELRTVNLKLRIVIIGAESANLQFENDFPMGIKRFLHPFVPDISQLTEELIPSKKEEEEYHWRRI